MAAWLRLCFESLYILSLAEPTTKLGREPLGKLSKVSLSAALEEGCVRLAYTGSLFIFMYI